MGRILGVDLGARRIGLAVSDPSGIIASPLGTIERSGDSHRDRVAIVAAANESEASIVVVGLPREMSGRMGPAAKAARAEVEALRALAPTLQFELVDERMTTVIAQRSLIDAGVRRKARKQTVDKVAAAVILRSYLESRPARSPRTNADE
ncbi:MAG: Holliday junction resolvase RuvX [Acidimicrobiia bacterium]